jgi:hypothetical protein
MSGHRPAATLGRIRSKEDLMSPFRIAFATAALALVAAAPAPAATSVFGGSTNAGEPIALTGDQAAKKLRTMVIAVAARCADGNYYPVATRLSAAHAKHNAGGRFAGTVTSSVAPTTLKITLSGRLARTRASGKLAVDVTSTDGSLDCHSGTVRWSATRSPGHVYAGSTSQNEPVVVKVNRKRTNVDDVLIGWETDSCTTQDFFYRQGEDFTDFPLRAGHFGDGFSNTFDDGSGGKVRLDYSIDGAVKRTASKGTLRVGLTNTDATGATKMSCDSGTIAWRTTTG